jgi:hypothetical protein
VNTYISFLLDNHSKIDKSIEIDCKSELVAEEVASFLKISNSGQKVKGEFEEIFDKVVPIEKYSIYHEHYLNNLLPITCKPAKDDGYIAAIIDYHGIIKASKRDDRNYIVIDFRKKSILNDVSHYFKKSYKSSLTIQGKDLLFALDRLADHLIIKKKEAELITDILARPEDIGAFDRWMDYTKKNKNSK